MDPYSKFTIPHGFSNTITFSCLPDYWLLIYFYWSSLTSKPFWFYYEAQLFFFLSAWLTCFQIQILLEVLQNSFILKVILIYMMSEFHEVVYSKNCFYFLAVALLLQNQLWTSGKETVSFTRHQLVSIM